MTDRATRWYLYVDESGDFANADEDVLVGSVLLASCPEAVPLRRALQSAAPWAPWPLHTAFLHRPAFIALAVAAAAERREVPPDPLAHVALAHMRATHADLVDRALGALVDGRAPTRDTVRALDDRLRSHASYGALCSRRRVVFDAIHSVVRAVVERQRALLGASPVPQQVDVAAVAVVSAEAVRGTAGENGPTGDRETDRYFALLDVLFSHVVGLIGRVPGRHEVYADVLTRDVFDPELKRRIPMSQRHARYILSLANPSGMVAMRLADVPRFDRLAHPAVVFADFVAARVRPATRGAARTLTAVERDGERASGFRLRSGEPATTHVAVTRAGTARVRRWAQEALAESAALA